MTFLTGSLIVLARMLNSEFLKRDDVRRDPPPKREDE